jgi:glycosyltransferase involved in cell wall biosynthesis
LQPRISMIIPSYNCRSYLPTAFDSIRRQGIAELEVIVIDDGSTDGTREFLAAEAAADPRLVVINLEGRKNGPAAARNAGLRSARAPIVAFLDADDFLYPDALGDRLALHESDPSIALSFGDYRSVSPEGRDLGRYFAFRRNFTRWIGGRTGLLPLGDRALAMIFAEAVCGTSTAMASRDALLAIGGFRVDLVYSQDWECWLRLAGQGAVWCATRVVTGYLVRPDSHSRNLQSVLAVNKKIFDLHEAAARALDPHAVRIGRAELARVAAEAARAQGRRLSPLYFNLKAVSLDPSMHGCRAVAYDGLRLIGMR